MKRKAPIPAKKARKAKPVPPSRRGGKAPTDRRLVAKAMKLLDAGSSVVEAAEKAGIPVWTVYRERGKRKRDGARVAAATKRKASRPTTATARIPTTTQERQQLLANGLAATTMAIERLVGRLEEGLSAPGLGALIKVQESQLDALDRFKPKEDPDAERLRWRAAADSALRKIESGVADAEKRIAGRGGPNDGQ
jgi:hypothetical protein